MSNVSRAALALALVAGLGACGGAPDTPANEGSEANEAAAASNPFADAEQKMNDAMMAAIGSDVGQNWAKKMLAHHQGAIDMSEIVLGQNPPAQVAEMARMTIEKQRKDMADIEKLIREGAPDRRSADLYRVAMAEMKQKMEAATGADASQTYLRKMLEHHKGAVAMSDVALQNRVSGNLREQVQKTRDENAKDAKMAEAMLRGESMQDAMKDSGAKSAREAKSQPAVTDKPKEATAPAAPPKPSAPGESKPAAATANAADPHAGHVMNVN